MANENVHHFDDSTFENEVLRANQPVLVDFWAPWCAPCQMIAPAVDELATEFAGQAKIGKINIDDHQMVAQRYNVMSIPTLLVFKGGQVVDQVVGAVGKEHLRGMLKRAVG